MVDVPDFPPSLFTAGERSLYEVLRVAPGIDPEDVILAYVLLMSKPEYDDYRKRFLPQIDHAVRVLGDPMLACQYLEEFIDGLRADLRRLRRQAASQAKTQAFAQMQVAQGVALPANATAPAPNQVPPPRPTPPSRPMRGPERLQPVAPRVIHIPAKQHSVVYPLALTFLVTFILFSVIAIMLGWASI